MGIIGNLRHWCLSTIICNYPVDYLLKLLAKNATDADVNKIELVGNISDRQRSPDSFEGLPPDFVS